ncbi:MAG: 50S ribosomal protein L4 [Cyclobacteriaceae bacterium]
MKLSVLNIKGEDTGREVTLDESVFGIDPNEHTVYLEIKQFLANQRQGTAKVKTRNEISGSTRKIKKQKGTGTARAGSIKSPVFRGGGTMFGPEPRDHSFKLNKKVKTKAKISAFSAKAKDDRITILEDVVMDSPKTKSFLEILKNLNVDNKKSLFIIGDASKNFYLSSRNIQNTKVSVASEINIFDLVHCDQLVLTEGAIEVIQKRFN